MGLLSASTLRSRHLPDVDAGDSDAMTQLAAFLATRERRAATWLGYPGSSPTWESASYTLRLAARGDTQRLYLPVNPVTAIASVYQDTLMAFGAATAVASTQYEQEDTRHGPILHLLPSGTTGAWLEMARSIKVTCTAGYANEAAIPPDLADAVYLWAAMDWTGRRVRTVESASQGGTSQQFREAAAPPPELEPALADYSLWSVLGVE